MDRTKDLQGALMTIKKECMAHMDCEKCPLSEWNTDSQLYECTIIERVIPNTWDSSMIREVKNNG